MKAVIKSIHSADLTVAEKDIYEYVPLEKDFFGFDLSVEVGILGEEGQEIFNFFVASPKYLTEKYYKQKGEKAIFGRHLIIAFEYDFHKIYALIDDYVKKLEESNWENLAGKINRIGHWEFEDYDEG